MQQHFAHLYLIGLTGNIGCGKSTVVAMLQQRGAHVLDADQVTREVMQIGQPAYDRIVATFGDEILLAPGGAIDRPALGRIVFGNADRLRALEAIVHPATREWIFDWLRQRDTEAQQAGRRQIAVIDAIRLIEGGYTRICDSVWVVACDPEVQIRRLVEGRGMPEADARQRIAAQPPQQEKIAVADVVIDNSSTRDNTEQQLDRAWQQILAAIT